MKYQRVTSEQTSPRSVLFQVKRVYYDQYVAGTKKYEIRAWKPYWLSRLIPLPLKGDMPTIAIISNPGQPILRFKIESIKVYLTETLINEGILTEKEYKAFINAHDCIVTFLGDRIQTTQVQLTLGDLQDAP